MKVLITIPVHHYYQLLANCEPSSQEYKMLTSPVPDGEQNPDDRDVHIFCEAREAKAFLAWAKQINPAAASEIRIAESFLSRVITNISQIWISLLGFTVVIGGFFSLARSVSAGETPQLGLALIVCGFAMIIAGEMLGINGVITFGYWK